MTRPAVTIYITHVDRDVLLAAITICEKKDKDCSLSLLVSRTQSRSNGSSGSSSTRSAKTSSAWRMKHAFMCAQLSSHAVATSAFEHHDDVVAARNVSKKGPNGTMNDIGDVMSVIQKLAKKMVATIGFEQTLLTEIDNKAFENGREIVQEQGNRLVLSMVSRSTWRRDMNSVDSKGLKSTKLRRFLLRFVEACQKN
ncbi:23S rRNA (uracil(1939)-C(5))-methyltransferaseRlmD [Striga asiatica]|uniref:23S rRNA (Uracil(1939)-C(5))-methyltransferaseRlmD n=1 Tax=Striga asiatica TaxID=4170 RepID=A0A5A7PUE7_STRAF|nr:23S rRNA (uracil(1939)-C(5))-methyltransferaseRlmD [Striga asiatica]